MTSLRYLWQSRISVIFSCQRSRIMISTKTGCYLPRPENVYSLVFLFTKVETEWQKCKQKLIEIKAFLLFYHTKEMKKCYFTGATMTIQNLASLWKENIHGYLIGDIICPGKGTICHDIWEKLRGLTNRLSKKRLVASKSSYCVFITDLSNTICST